MNSTNMFIGILVLVLLGGGVYYFAHERTDDAMMPQGDSAMHGTASNDMASSSDMMTGHATSTEAMMQSDSHDGVMIDASTSANVMIH